MNLKTKALWVTSQPHRLFFASGTLLMISTIFWWVTYLGHKYFHVIPQYTFDPKLLHSLLMIYVTLTTYILGFILTVYPKWLGGQSIGRTKILFFWALIPVGGIVAWSGTKLGQPALIAGSTMVSLGFALLAQHLVFIYFKSNMPDRTQPFMALCAFIAGGIGSAYFVAYTWDMDQIFYYQVSIGLGVYLYLPLVILSVAFRMLPFFTNILLGNEALRGFPWVLKAWGFLLVVKASLYFLDLKEWYLLSDSLLLLVTLWQFKHWRFFAPKPKMLLSYLYIALAWFPLGLVFFIIGGALAFNSDFYPPIFELAGLHSWAIGFFSSMIYAMTTRVTLGHSGRSLDTTKFEDRLFWLLQFTAFYRVAAELAGLIDYSYTFWAFGAGFTWCFAFGLWAWAYFPIYFKTRLDQPDATP
ncbi:MAG: NnrS family protein [SAR324 cluster bacterium]|nr:NnrS family protein [SAR324 cluster bacterium]